MGRGLGMRGSGDGVRREGAAEEAGRFLSYKFEFLSFVCIFQVTDQIQQRRGGSFPGTARQRDPLAPCFGLALVRMEIWMEEAGGEGGGGREAG